MSGGQKAEAKNVQNTAMSNLPVLNVNRIITTVAEVASGQKDAKAAAVDLARPYQAFAKEFAKDKASELLAKGIDAAGLHELADRGFSDQLVETSGKIASWIQLYAKGEMKEEKLVELFMNSGIHEVSGQILSALGIHGKLGLENPAEILKLTPPVLAYTASMAAYKELRKAMNDLMLAREARIMMEAACGESIAMIRAYRADMERIVSEYLTDHLEVFEAGFAAMDQALMNGDTDGYLRGNAEIQEILGYNVQFTNQDEFDALMEGDEAFKL